MVKRVPAPSWHLPQVLGRFLAFTMLLGSLERRMLCTPWQLAQLATVWEPLLAARPWKEESKLTKRSLGMPNLRVRRTSPWQLPQVSRMWLTFTGLAALVCFRILCSPWQSVHSGVTQTPLCTDCHGEHKILKHTNAASPVNVSHIRDTCGSCHGDVRLTRKFGMPNDRLVSFDSSFHGLAAKSGSQTVANCASCHGVHNILASSNPKSMVLSLIHISEPTRLGMISYAVFCLKK